MFKKIFCKHKYKYYTTAQRTYFPAISSWDTPLFVCTKCEKTVEMYGSHLYDIVQKAQELKNKKKVLGESLDSYQDEVLDLGMCKYSGFIAYYIKGQYPNIFKNLEE